MNSFTKIFTLSITLAAVSACYATPAFPCCPADEHSIGRPDAHAPISVMGDHTHSKGGLMLSYRYMNMQMDGMRSGTKRVNSQNVFAANYAVAPENMTMEMHMLGMMYAPTYQLTLMAMANYIDTTMNHRVNPAVAGMINGGDSGFTTDSSGDGDIKLSALYRFYLEGKSKAHLGIGLSLPTGSIDEKDDTPAMGGRRRQLLPAPMQLGSGTFDLLPSFTYVQQFTDWSWGAQASGAIRLESENDSNYRLGNKFELLIWAGYNLADWLGLNGGLSYALIGELKGSQKDLNTNAPMERRSVTTAFSDNYGGERIDVIFGINLLKPTGFLKGHRLAFDLSLPIWCDLTGYQLESGYALTFGWQKAF
jgi:hypothetical protein